MTKEKDKPWINFPITRSDFERWGKIIEERERKQEEKIRCPTCKEVLENYSGIIFTKITFLKCNKCRKRFQRSKYNGKYFLIELGK